MRISDWSSDGCSSDLAWVPCGQILAALVGPLALRTSGWQALWIASLLLAGLLAGWALYTLRRSPHGAALKAVRSEEHASELQSLMRSSYAVFCLKKKNTTQTRQTRRTITHTHEKTCKA